MSKKRRSFSPEFKSKVVLEALSGIKEINELAAELLDINRTSVYYKGRQVSDTELEIMNHIHHMHTDHPTWGKRQLASQLQDMGYKIGKYKVRRFMDLMGIEVIYPKPSLSKPAKYNAPLCQDRQLKNKFISL